MYLSGVHPQDRLLGSSLGRESVVVDVPFSTVKQQCKLMGRIKGPLSFS